MTVKSPNPIDIYVGARIRARRLMLGMSQTSLADRLGITFQQVQKYEKGTNRVGSSRLMAISEVLGVPVAYFFEQEPDKPESMAGIASPDEASVLSTFLLSREGISLNKAFLKIRNPKTRKAIVGLAKALSDQEDSFVMELDEIGDTDHLHLN